MSESRVPLALSEYLNFIRHDSRFGPRVVMRGVVEMLGLVNQERAFEEILAFSGETGWRFTLFFTARNLWKHGHWVERFIEQGHEIASHSYSHRLLTAMSDDELRKELVDAEECFDELGLKPAGLRAPFLAADSRLPELAKEFGFSYISSQHGGFPFIHSSGVWEFPVTKPYDWYGLRVMRLDAEGIGKLWVRNDGVVTLIHPRYFDAMRPIILGHHGNYRKDKRVCSLLKNTGGNERPGEQALSFDIY